MIANPPNSDKQSWTRGIVHQILINPKYVGSNVYNRRSFKLKQRRVANPEPMWVRRDDAFPAIIPHDLFAEAAKIIERRGHRFTDGEMVEKLHQLFLQKGRLSGIIIDEVDGAGTDTPWPGPDKKAYRPRSRLELVACSRSLLSRPG